MSPPSAPARSVRNWPRCRRAYKSPSRSCKSKPPPKKTSISAWGTIQGAVFSLSCAVVGIVDLSTLNNRSATISATTIATASNTPAPGATACTEAITLSSDAQNRTQLLDAARIAVGASHPVIPQLRAAIQSNSSNIPPQALAGAIATAMKERQA